MPAAGISVCVVGCYQPLVCLITHLATIPDGNCGDCASIPIYLGHNINHNLLSFHIVDQPALFCEQHDWLQQTLLFDLPTVRPPSAPACCLPELYHVVIQGVSTDPEKLGPKAAVVNGKNVLQLLNHCSGSFRPGILTALVGSSGAGKTTLMDVLAGRKTSEPLSHCPHLHYLPLLSALSPPPLPTPPLPKPPFRLSTCLVVYVFAECCVSISCCCCTSAHSVFPAGCGMVHWVLHSEQTVMCPAAGTIDGDVRVSGHPKVQKTFARVMGYVEQSDIHSPNVSTPSCTQKSCW